jgi:hypothetical protein
MRSLHQFLVVALGVSFSAAAFAHSPPALVKRQQAASHATRESGGYRDIHTRFGNTGVSTPEGTHMASGYRDINWRFGGAMSSRRVMARTVPAGS